MHKWIIGVALAATTLLMAGAAQAATTTQVADFDSEEGAAKMIKYHGSLYAMTESTEGNTLSIYKASSTMEEWTDVTDESTVFSDMSDSLVDVDFIRIFNGKFYIFGTNADGETELWRKQKSNNKNFKEVTVDFADETVTAVAQKRSAVRQRLFNKRNKKGTEGRANELLVFTTTDDGANLYTSKKGKTWTQVGETGLGNSVDEVHGVWKRKIGDTRYMIVGADDMLIKATLTDFETWAELTVFGDAVESGGEVSSVRGSRGKLYVSYVDSDGVPQVFMSNRAVSEFSQAGEDKLGNSNVESITKLVKFRPHGPVFAAVENSTDGAELYRWDTQDSEWVLVSSVDDATSTAFESLVRYKGMRYLGTVNTTNGAEVYSLSK